MTNKVAHKFEKRIAIVIPSFQRLDYLKRLLAYLINISCPFRIYIGNYCRSKKNRDDIADVIKPISSRLDICLYDLESKTLFTAMRELLNLVEEEYVLYLEDDHYIFPNGIIKCAKFLRRNPSYRAAHGFSIVADEGKNFPSIKYMNHYMMWGNRADRLESRLKKINQTGLTYLSVRRTAELIEDLSYIGLYSDENFDELLVNHLSIIKGRVRKISTLFLIRPYPRPKIYNIPKAFDWLGNQNWVKAYDIYARSIQNTLKLHGLDNRAVIFWQEKILSEYMVIRFGGRLKSLRNKTLNLYNKTILKVYILTLLAVNYKCLVFVKQV